MGLALGSVTPTRALDLGLLPEVAFGLDESPWYLSGSFDIAHGKILVREIVRLCGLADNGRLIGREGKEVFIFALVYGVPSASFCGKVRLDAGEGQKCQQ